MLGGTRRWLALLFGAVLGAHLGCAGVSFDDAGDAGAGRANEGGTTAVLAAGGSGRGGLGGRRASAGGPSGQAAGRPSGVGGSRGEPDPAGAGGSDVAEGGGAGTPREPDTCTFGSVSEQHCSGDLAYALGPYTEKLKGATLAECELECARRRSCTAVIEYAPYPGPELCGIYHTSCDSPSSGVDWYAEDAAKDYRKVCDADECRLEYLGDFVRCPETETVISIPDAQGVDECKAACLADPDCTGVSDYFWHDDVPGCYVTSAPCDSFEAAPFGDEGITHPASCEPAHGDGMVHPPRRPTCDAERVVTNLPALDQDELNARLWGVTRVEGNLTLEGPTSLLALSCLTSVEGQFEVLGAPGLESLDGLENLETVGGDFTLADVRSLESLAPLARLRSVGMTFSVSNSALPDLEGLGSLEADRLDLRNNASLTTLDGFPAVTQAEEILLFDNAALSTLGPLSSADVIQGSLVLVHNGLASYDFPYLFGVSGMLHLEEAAPTDLHGLEQLEYLGGDLYLGGQLTSLEGLRSLGAIGGKLTIASPKLPDLSDLSENWQAGALVLSGADALTDLHGVTKPDVEELSIVACHRLTSLDGIEGGSFPDGLRLENNPLLEDLGALAGYTTLGGLTIHGNQSLPNLNGLEGLTSLSGDLSISGRCEQFCTDGDDDGEDVCVERCEQNAALTSLRALAGLGWVGGNLEIFGNPSLPACEAEWLLGSIGASNVRSTITIAHNDGIGVCP